MYHNLNDFLNKIDVIKQKADKIRYNHNITFVDMDVQDQDIKFEIDDIRALCADIVNDKEH